MNKIEYLKHSIHEGWVEHISWLFSAFSIPINRSANTPLSFGGTILAEPWGYSVTNIEDTPTKITDAKPKEPLYNFSDPITIDESWFPNVQGSITTTIGNVIVNAIVIVPSFHKKIPFITGTFVPSTVEKKYIAPKLHSNPQEGKEDPSFIYVRDYLKFCKRVAFLEALVTLSCTSATEKNVAPPPGITEFKKALLEKHKDELHKPEVLSMIQDKLQEYDDKYLEGDPGQKFLTGKVKNQRKKMYQMVGMGLSFKQTGDISPITNSLNEGWSKNPEDLAAMFNDQRYGSFARGAETINGGVAGKYIIRTLSGYSIVDGDCGTKLGSIEVLRQGEEAGYAGRYITEGGKVKLLATKEDVGAYLGKQITMRTPRMCKSPDLTFCRVCSGEALFRFKNSLVIPGTEISNTILYANMKLFHTSGLKTKKLELSDGFF